MRSHFSLHSSRAAAKSSSLLDTCSDSTCREKHFRIGCWQKYGCTLLFEYSYLYTHVCTLVFVYSCFDCVRQKLVLVVYLNNLFLLCTSGFVFVYSYLYILYLYIVIVYLSIFICILCTSAYVFVYFDCAPQHAHLPSPPPPRPQLASPRCLQPEHISWDTVLPNTKYIYSRNWKYKYSLAKYKIKIQ